MSDDTNRKTIQINESFLHTDRKTKQYKKTQKVKPTAFIKPNKLKKDLIEKIKKYQQNEKIKNKPDDNTTINNTQDSFNNDFINSLDYLDKLSDKEKVNKKKRRNKTLKNTLHTGGGTTPNVSFKDEIPLVSIDLPIGFDDKSAIPLNNLLNYSHIPIPIIPNPQSPPVSIKPTINNTTSIENIKIPDSPSYGCLKGGAKPTFRQFHNKTLKNTHIFHDDNTNHTNDDIHNRHHNLQKLKQSYKKYRQKSKKTRKYTYTLGKQNNSISVLVKNNKTRRNIKREHGLLKQKPLLEIKKYLYDRNLLKIGSSAPNDVLRTLYEQSILAGDINNINHGVTLHNFMQK